MRYIAILDHHHLDHSFFMKSFSEAMAQQRGCKGIILHADSSYTERLIQTGMMRGDAKIRSTKDLNHRIVSLLADSNIPATGIHGYQKKIVHKSDNQLFINKYWFNNMPEGIHLVLSNLIYDSKSDDIGSLPLTHLASVLQRELEFDAILIFPRDVQEKKISAPATLYDADDKSLFDDIQNKFRKQDNMLEELKLPAGCGFFCSLDEFKKLPDTTGLTKIQAK